MPHTVLRTAVTHCEIGLLFLIRSAAAPCLRQSLSPLLLSRCRAFHTVLRTAVTHCEIGLLFLIRFVIVHGKTDFMVEIEIFLYKKLTTNFRSV